MSDCDFDDDRPLEDWEYPDGEDDELADATPTRECPKCGVDVYDDAVRCPLCGEYFTKEGGGIVSMPFWMQLAAVAALIGMGTAVWFCF
jgi:hypothetical protein